MALARFSPPAPPLSGHVPRRRRFAPVRQLLKFLRIFPVISYIFINILSYKNLYPIPLRILYLHIMFVFDIFAFDIFSFDIFPFDIFPFNIFPFDIFTIQIHFYNIPKNPQMCPAHRDLPTPTHPHSRLNFPHPIPSHTYNGLKTISLPTTPQAVLLHRLNLPYPIPQHTDTSQQNSHPPQPSTQKKARGVCRGAAALRPLCGFPIFAKKYCVRSPTRTKHSIFQKYFFTFCYLTTRTLYIPSISLSSSNALADAALSRSIRV